MRTTAIRKVMVYYATGYTATVEVMVYYSSGTTAMGKAVVD